MAGWISNLVTRSNETAVYWAANGLDNYGQPSYASAVEIDCRWIDKVEEYLDGQGEKKISNAHVMVTQQLVLNGMLYLGTIVDLAGATDPKQIVGAYEIRQKLELKDIDGLQTFYRVIL